MELTGANCSAIMETVEGRASSVDGVTAGEDLGFRAPFEHLLTTWIVILITT